MIRTYPCNFPQHHRLPKIHVECIPRKRATKWCPFSQIDAFHQYVPYRIDVLFLSSHFLHRPRAQTRFFLVVSHTGIRHQELFSHRRFWRNFLEVSSHQRSASGWPYIFRSSGTTGSSILDRDFDHLCRGRRIQMSGHSDLGIFHTAGVSSILTCVYADTASAVCPAHLGSLTITSISFAAVVCHADEPCSVNSVVRVWIMFHNVISSITHGLRVFEWIVLLSLCASWTTSCLLLTFVNCHASIFSSFSTAAFASCIFQCLRLRVEVVHKIWMTQWIESRFCNMIFVIFGLSSLQTLSRRFVSFHDACTLWLLSIRSGANFHAFGFSWLYKAQLLPSAIPSFSAHSCRCVHVSQTVGTRHLAEVRSDSAGQSGRRCARCRCQCTQWQTWRRQEEDGHLFLGNTSIEAPLMSSLEPHTCTKKSRVRAI